MFRELSELGFQMTDEGTLEEYLGLQIESKQDGTFRISQFALTTTNNRYDPEHAEREKQQDTRCTRNHSNERPERRTQKRNMALQVSHWNVELPRDLYPPRNLLRGPPVR